MGTSTLIATNVAVWGLYQVAPNAPVRATTPWERWLRSFGAPTTQSPPSQSMSQAFEALKKRLPPKQFWERHFFASYYGVVQQKEWETVALCNFMHVDGWHLAFNMITLFFFGRHLEPMLGLGRYLCFYLGSGALATGAQLFTNRERERFVQCIGASGGVYALIAYTTFLNPRAMVYIYFILPVPMWLVLAGMVAADVFNLLPNQGHTAHLAGVGCGAAYFLLARRGFR